MKLAGFSICLPGSIEVDLRSAGDDNLRQKLAICGCCDHVCPKMHLTDCAHVFCDRCVLKLPMNRNVPSAFCVICRRAATITDVQTPEPLVAKLPCLCPCCEIVLGADELRQHFAGCVLVDGSTGSDIPAASCASTCPASATKMLSKLQNSHSEQDSKQSAISVQPSKDTSVLTPDCPDSAPQKTSRASQYETRLATTDECRRQSVKPATYPIESACYILQFYPSARGDSVQIYRTLPVYLGNVGFYFAAHKSTRNVGMWFSYFDIGQQQSNTIKLTWKVTIWCGQEVQGEGRSATVRNPQIGQHVHFSSVFDSYEREMAIITVRIEKLS